MTGDGAKSKSSSPSNTNPRLNLSVEAIEAVSNSDSLIVLNDLSDDEWNRLIETAH